MSTHAPLLPVMLRLENRPCVVIGAGKVAVRRVASLLECGALVTVIAPEASEEIRSLAAAGRLTWLARAYEWGDLHNAFLAILASSEPEAHDEATKEAQVEGVLINRTDAPRQSDLDVPAHARQGRLTLAIHTGGASARAAADIRDELLGKMDPAWPAFLDALADARAQVLGAMHAGPQREATLRLLAGPDGKKAFTAGGAKALLAMAGLPSK